MGGGRSRETAAGVPILGVSVAVGIGPGRRGPDDPACGVARGGLHRASALFLTINGLDDPPGGVTDDLPARLGGEGRDKEHGTQQGTQNTNDLGTHTGGDGAQ